LYVNSFLCFCKYISFCIISEEIEKREKALVEELNLIEVQIGSKHSQNFEASSSLHTIEAPRLIEEGEENRDPNPEHNIEVAISNSNVDISMQSLINENLDNDHTTKKKEEAQLDQVQSDVNNG